MWKLMGMKEKKGAVENAPCAGSSTAHSKTWGKKYCSKYYLMREEVLCLIELFTYTLYTYSIMIVSCWKFSFYLILFQKLKFQTDWNSKKTIKF